MRLAFDFSHIVSGNSTISNSVLCWTLGTSDLCLRMLIAAVDERLAQVNADNGHQLFAISQGHSAQTIEEELEQLQSSAPPVEAAQKNSEEVPSSSDEGVYLALALSSPTCRQSSFDQTWQGFSLMIKRSKLCRRVLWVLRPGNRSNRRRQQRLLEPWAGIAPDSN